MRRKILRYILVAMMILSAFLGISMNKKLFDSSFFALIEERDEQLYSLADSIDIVLTHKIREVYLDYKLIISNDFFEDTESTFLNSNNTSQMQEIFEIEDLKNENKISAILVYKGDKLFTLKGDKQIKSYTFFEDKYDMHAFPCCDEAGNYYLAVQILSEKTDQLKYYVLMDIASLYTDMVPADMVASNWIVFYNEDADLCIQNHDNQPAYRILSNEEIEERQDGYTIIMHNDLLDQLGAETYQYANYEGKVVDERIITVPASLTENRIFAIGISRDSELLYETIRNNSRYQIYAIALVVAFCFIMLMLIIMSINRERRLQKEKEYLEKERELVQQLTDAQLRNSVSQMQPHFMYNVLASIRELILDDPEYAADMLYDFTWYLRACIRSLGSRELIPFDQELENIKAYVRIEQMRMGDGLEVDYQIEDHDFKITPFGIQPLIENAIKHGIAKKRGKQGHINLRTEKIGDTHMIFIEDDGVGFDYEQIVKEIAEGRRDSTGVQNTRFRLGKILNASIHVDSVIDKGTKIIIEIPDDPSWH